MFASKDETVYGGVTTLLVEAGIDIEAKDAVSVVVPAHAHDSHCACASWGRLA